MVDKTIKKLNEDNAYAVRGQGRGGGRLVLRNEEVRRKSLPSRKLVVSGFQHSWKEGRAFELVGSVHTDFFPRAGGFPAHIEDLDNSIAKQVPRVAYGLAKDIHCTEITL